MTRQLEADNAASIYQQIDAGSKRIIDLASEKGASSWLTCRPLKRHGFRLHKTAFRDGICLRFGWTPERMPSHRSCGKVFNIEHALYCAPGGFPSMRHNEVSDITAHMLRGVAYDVAVEPDLQPLMGEHFVHLTAITGDSARLDVAASRVWGGRFERTFFDVRVFNHLARSNRNPASLASVYAKHEREKRRCYEDRVLHVEHASFVPVVLSCTGGQGKAAAVLYRRIASLSSEKSRGSFSSTLCVLRAKLCFALIRSTTAAIRGHRRPNVTAIVQHRSADLVVAECELA